MNIEQDLLFKIKEHEELKKISQNIIKNYKKLLIDEESIIIFNSIKISSLKEELRINLSLHPKYEESMEEKELREFRERLPEVISKLK